MYSMKRILTCSYICMCVNFTGTKLNSEVHLTKIAASNYVHVCVVVVSMV